MDKGLHFDQRFRFDLLTADGDDLVDGAVTNHLPHDGFGDSAQCGARLANVEQELHRVGNAVLNHPLDERGIQIARHHLRFLRAILRALVRIGGARSREPEFLLQLSLDRNDCGDVNP